MKKQWVAGALAVVLALSIGTAVARAEGSQNGFWQDMLSYMKLAHPDLSEQQLNQMVQYCQSQAGTGSNSGSGSGSAYGMMGSGTGTGYSMMGSSSGTGYGMMTANSSSGDRGN